MYYSKDEPPNLPQLPPLNTDDLQKEEAISEPDSISNEG